MCPLFLCLRGLIMKDITEAQDTCVTIDVQRSQDECSIRKDAKQIQDTCLITDTKDIPGTCLSIWM